MRSDLKKKLDSFTLETSKNHLIRNFLHNGRVRVTIAVPNRWFLHSAIFKMVIPNLKYIDKI